MEHFLNSGRLTDLALAVIAIEALGLFLVRQRTQVGLRPPDLLGQLLAGGMLILALRCSLTGANYLWTLGFVSASFPAHLYDVTRRARGAKERAAS